MEKGLESLFDSLATPDASDAGRPIYAVVQAADNDIYFVGKDNVGQACVLVRTTEADHSAQAPIRLESIEVQFEVPSLLRWGNDTTEGTFTVIRCRSADREIKRYFLSVCETIIRILGDKPTRAAVSKSVNRLALIFQRLREPPTRSVNGLFGELFLIRQSRSPLSTLAAWRIENVSRFDFSAGDARLEVKTASGRSRVHEFSYDQCNPPPGTIAVVASLFVERSTGGISLLELINDIERLAHTSSDLVVKLHDVVASTLGSALPEGLLVCFDQRLAGSSIRFYDLRDIPAIRGDQPAGISDIRFRSDLSGIEGLAISELSQRDEAVANLLPESEN